MSESLQTVERLQTEVAPVVQQATALAVTNPGQYENAAGFLKVVKGAQGKVTAFFGPMKAKAHAAWKEITATEASTLKPLSDAEATIKRKMLDYAQAEEAKRQAEQRRLRAEADAKARAEQERLLKLAESRKTPEKQQEYREAAAAVAAPVVNVAPKTPVVAGQSLRKTWKARVVDVSLVPREYMVVNESALQAFARATKGAVKLPGVEMYEETTLASASK